MTLNNVFNRVAHWNGLRYPRIYNHSLTLDLLREEHQEFLDATEPVDKLDALCDIIYVACGALWKLKVDRLCLLSLAKPNNWIDSIETDSDIILLKGLILSTAGRMIDMGLSVEQCNIALNIVCDSNDSKSVRMTAPGVKANIDKGTGFVAPEPRLKELLEQVSWSK